MNDIRINYSRYRLENGEYGVIAIFMYIGNGDPKSHLDKAIRLFCNGENHYEFIDAQLNCPWVKVVLSHIDAMRQEQFDPKKHRLLSISEERKKKLKIINKNEN